MDHIFETELELPMPRDDVFAFFSEAKNLETITPTELRFRIVTPEPVEIYEGALIDYRLSLFGLPFGWRTKITRFDPPRLFVDEQLRGPYKAWIHTHTFEPTEKGTLIRDHVRYRLPLYPLGELALPLVRLQIRRIFAFRSQAVSAALLGPA